MRHLNARWMFCPIGTTACVWDLNCYDYEEDHKPRTYEDAAWAVDKWKKQMSAATSKPWQLQGKNGVELAKKAENFATKWLADANHTKADKYTFNPKLPPGLQPTNDEGQVLFNSWLGLAVTPGEGNWSLIHKMLLEHHCDNSVEKLKHLLQWCAYRVRYPGRKMDVYANSTKM